MPTAWPDRYTGKILRMGSLFPTHCTAVVHSVFRNTVNFRDTATQTLHCVTAHATSLHPLAALMEVATAKDPLYLFDGIVPGSYLRCTGDRIVFECGRWVSLRGAKRTDWKDEHPPTANQKFIDPMRLSTIGRQVISLQRKLDTQVCLASLGSNESNLFSSIVTNLHLAWKAGDQELALHHALQLAGLGEGYTPSGDDMLCGIACALWVRTGMGTGAQGLQSEAKVAAWCTKLHHIACTTHRTHEVSLSMLKCASLGLFGQSLINLATLISSEDTVDNCTPESVFLLLCSTGHSSGLDAATGFLYAIDPVACIERRLYVA